MNGALIEQAEVNDLVNHVREGDEYAFLEGGGAIRVLYLQVVNILKFQ